MEKGRKFSFLGFAGSLRKDSFNKMILRAALEAAPENVQFEIFDLEGIPPFNQDLEREPPPRVVEFKAKIREADAILIATPEYNYSMPGVLKNAIDWATRPYGDNVLLGKPAAIMGASIGMLGSARAQYHLRQTMVYLDMHPLNQPEIMVPFVDKKIDESGRLADEATRDKIKSLVASLVEWTGKIRGDRS